MTPDQLTTNLNQITLSASPVLDSILQNEVLITCFAIITIAITIYVVSWLINVIRDFQTQIEATNTTKDYRDNWVISDNIENEVAEYNVLDEVIEVADAQGDKTRVAIYKKRQQQVLKSASNRCKFLVPQAANLSALKTGRR